MKNVMNAYLKLRKSWLICLYALIILVGITSMIHDSVQWHRWEAAVNKQVNEKDYQATRHYLKTHPKADIYGQDFPKKYLKYVDIIQSVTDVSEKYAYTSASKLYKCAPSDYRAVKKELLQYYQVNRGRDRAGSNAFLSSENKHILGDYATLGNLYVNVTINNIALMSLGASLVFVGIYALLLLLDQASKITAFMKSRTGGINTLSFAQFIYWIAIPLGLTAVLSVVTHLTRFLFIPSQYITIPWHDIVRQALDSVSLAFILVLAIAFVHALVGKMFYKILTLVLAIPALCMAYVNISDLLNLSSLNAVLRQVPIYVYMLILGSLFIPVIMLLQNRYSVEQDTSYIKLARLRFPFYIAILLLVVTDFILAIFLYTSVNHSLLSLIVLLGLTIAIPIIFAKLVLNKDIRKLLVK